MKLLRFAGLLLLTAAFSVATPRVSVAQSSFTNADIQRLQDAIYDASERRFIGFEVSTLTRPDPADGAAAASTLRAITRYAPGLGADRVLRASVRHASGEYFG